MLDPVEAQAVADRFGVSTAQVVRDHLISHLLAAISAHGADAVVFFGGTALARSLLPDGRMSEDIDLIAQGSRRDVAERLGTVLPRALRREYPGLYWDPALTRILDVAPALLRAPGGPTVRIQLLSSTGYPPWPFAPVKLTQRYRDAPAARLRVPTAAAFSASKTVAWADRAAARDLYDPWALATSGHLTADAGQLFARYGPTNRFPSADLFRTAPDQQRWQRDLGGQLRLTISAAEALAVVREGWAAARRLT